MNEMITQFDSQIALCKKLMETAHYKKIGAEGIFAIVQKAYSLGVNPLEALNGGLYFVKGKVEMSSNMMAKLIRQGGHSIKKDAKSDDSICILHGKRKDNGDEWTEYFSIQDAKRAGIYKVDGPWGKFPRAMLFARALSLLARQLFPDIISGCYVEGEIRDAIPLDQPVIVQDQIDEAEYNDLKSLLDENPELKENVMNYLQESHQILDLRDLSPKLYEIIYNRALRAQVKEA